MSKPDSVAILGLGYVGLPLAVGFRRAGLRVVGFDANPATASRLARGDSHVQDVSDGDLRQSLETGLYISSDPADLAGLGAYIICVPTPLGSDGHPDLRHVESAAGLVARMMAPGSLIVLESTTYPGTTEEIVLPLLQDGSGLTAGEQFHLAYSPERIDPGNPRYSVLNTPKVVGGLDEISLGIAADLYAALGIEVVRARGLREAELAKLLENTYRQVNIALVNEMLKFCSAMGIDLYDAIRCAATKPFGFEAFQPGPGVGGHCIPIDPTYLSYRVRAELGYSFRFVELAQEINASMPAFVVDRVQQALNEQRKAVSGSTIRLFGVTYKANIADTRESPAFPVARLLLERGAHLSFVDPFIEEWKVGDFQIPKADQMSEDLVDCAVLLQDHSAFAGLPWARLARCVIDTRGTLAGDSIRRLVP